MVKNETHLDCADEKLNELCATYEKEWETIASPKTYDINDTEIYSKIGKYTGLQITKEYRIAIGAAIVAYIQEELRIIRAMNRKKKDLIVYIKCPKQDKK